MPNPISSLETVPKSFTPDPTRLVLCSSDIARRSATSTPRRTARYHDDEHALWLLKRAFHFGHRAVNDAVRSYGVTPTQMGALNRLVQEPGLSGAEMARRLLVTPQAAQLALTALEKNGLVERRPDAKHGRIVRTYLTDEGQRVVDLCLERSFKAEDEFLSVLDAGERRTLIDLLSRLAKQ
jgi:DNA-binding MarR family transcriptional regulator